MKNSHFLMVIASENYRVSGSGSPKMSGLGSGTSKMSGSGSGNCNSGSRVSGIENVGYPKCLVVNFGPSRVN